MLQLPGRIKNTSGDITLLAVDAIVNAANKSLLGGGGIDGAINKAVGPNLLPACQTLGGCLIGEAKITAGFELPARRVIHTVGPRWYGGAREEGKQLARCYRSVFNIVRQNNLKTIAFPMISCGSYGYPAMEASAVALREVFRFLSVEPAVEVIYFVCLDRNTQSAYDTALRTFDWNV